MRLKGLTVFALLHGLWISNCRWGHSGLLSIFRREQGQLFKTDQLLLCHGLLPGQTLLHFICNASCDRNRRFVQIGDAFVIVPLLGLKARIWPYERCESLELLLLAEGWAGESERHYTVSVLRNLVHSARSQFANNWWLAGCWCCAVLRLQVIGNALDLLSRLHICRLLLYYSRTHWLQYLFVLLGWIIYLERQAWCPLLRWVGMLEWIEGENAPRLRFRYHLHLAVHFRLPYRAGRTWAWLLRRLRFQLQVHDRFLLFDPVAFTGQAACLRRLCYRIWWPLLFLFNMRVWR